MSMEYPSALEYLRSPESFDPGKVENVLDRHTRRLVGSDLPEASPVDDAAIADHWVTWYVDRVLDKMDTVTIVDGEVGLGKSNMTLWLGAKIRDRLGREMGTTRKLDLERDVVYRLSDLVRRVYASSREDPSVVIADEGCLIGAQSGSGLSEAGKLLDRTLSICRILGCSLFLISPSIWGVAAFVRARRAKVWWHVERRGLSTAFLLGSSVQWTPPRKLPFVKARQPWSKLRWPSLENDKIWSQYEPTKLEVTRNALVDAAIVAGKLERKAGLRPSGPEQMDYELPPPPSRSPCRFCGKAVGTHQLRQHEAACPKRPTR